MSVRPQAVSSPPAAPEPRTASGERPVALAPDSPQATRINEKFQLPDEALPSEYPPPPSDGPHKATRRMAVPESVKLLRAAIPTPAAFESVVIPAAPPAPRIDVEIDEDEDEDAGPSSSAETARPPAPPASRRSTRRELVNATGLFVLLVGSSVLAVHLLSTFLFP